MITGINYISNNSASTFRSCPRKFNLEYREKLRSVYDNVSLYFGVAIHETLHYYFKECQDIDMAVEYFGSIFDGKINDKQIMWTTNKIRKDGGDFKDAETCREYGEKMIRAYLEYWLDENMGMKVLESEIEFEFELPVGIAFSKNIVRAEDGYLSNGVKVKTIKYTGIIDKIVEIDGKIYVMDHKTLSQRYSTDFVNNDMAMTGYILGAESLGYKADGIIYDYLMKLKEPKFERVYTNRTPEQIAEFKEDTIDTVKAIQSGLKYKNISKDCSFCRFKKYCSKDEQASEIYYKEPTLTPALELISEEE